MKDLDIKAFKDIKVEDEDLDVRGNGCLDDCTRWTSAYRQYMKPYRGNLYCWTPNPYMCTCY